jgi:thiol-disulfide isomerase/thioredoxin
MMRNVVWTAASPVLVLAILLALSGHLPAAVQERTVTVTLYWGEGCPHCEREKVFLAELRKRHPGVIVREFEVWKNRENAAVYQQVLREAGIARAGVPATVVGGSVFMGFNESTGRAIAEAVARCELEGCPDRTARPSQQGGTIILPLAGELDPSKLSLPLFTVIIAGMDSFNPCAFFVLLFLLSMLVHARSRGRMFLIGGIFVFASGLVYFLFMAAWLNVFLVAGQIAAITLAGGIVALLIGAINVKDFFFFKHGVSLVIPETAKPRLFERMRGLLKAESVAAMTGGAVVLAVTANAYELLCTAGFPMIYTRVLTLRQLSPASYYRYLALYNVVYVVPLAVIVAVVTVTLGARKLTEWQGRQLKLLSGLMMAALGAVLVIEPELLNNALASVLMLATVGGLSSIIIAVTRRVRPKLMA